MQMEILKAFLFALLLKLEIFQEVSATKVKNEKDILEDRPIQLVKPDADHKKLILVEENIKLLHQITNGLATVAVVGKYHTGKSFLMNQLMMKSKGFGVGPYVKPETMGIWMWGKPIKITMANDEQISVIFLDTEGFAATNVSENYDAKIFAVSTLMSSFLIYNSVKIIDQGDIDYLELLSRRTQLFALRSQMSQAKWTDQFNPDLLKFPPLLWVVQDFVQAIGEGESSQEWLHRLMGTHVRENEDYSISLLEVFPMVDCQTLFFPAIKKELLMDLSKAEEEDLTDDYKLEMVELKKKLRRNIIPKEKNEKPLTGAELATLLRILVTAANEGSLSEVPTRWIVFMDKLQKTATEDCLKFYEAEISAVFNITDNVPIHMKFLIEQHKRASNDSVNLLKQLLLGLDDSYKSAKEELHEKLSFSFNQTYSINEKNIKLFCTEQLFKTELRCEQELQAIKIPVQTDDLVHKINEINKKKIIEFRDNIQDFVTSKILESYVNSLKINLKEKGELFLSHNRKAMEAILEKSFNKALDAFKSAIVRSEGNPMTETSLKQLHEISINQALKLFAEKALIARNENIFNIYLGNLKNKLAEECDKDIKNNEKLLETVLEKRIEDLAKAYNFDTGASKIQLPLNDSQLDMKLSYAHRHCIAQFKSKWDEFRNFPIFSVSLIKLEKELTKIAEQRKVDNVKAYTKEVMRPLNIAKDTILLALDHYDTVFKAKQYMQKVCLLQLNEGKPKSWPNDLKYRIISDFIESDTDLKKAIESKEGIWSNMIGFLQWLWWLINEALLRNF